MTLPALIAALDVARAVERICRQAQERAMVAALRAELPVLEAGGEYLDPELRAARIANLRILIPKWDRVFAGEDPCIVWPEARP
jgi:hypothetical protein